MMDSERSDECTDFTMTSFLFSMGTLLLPNRENALIINFNGSF